MITTVTNIRENFQVEEGCTDIFLAARIADVESVVADKFGQKYSSWEADTTESQYATQRKAVRKIVSNIVMCNLLRSYGYVITSFGVVTKKDEYSQPCTEEQRWAVAKAHEAKASETFRALCASEDVDYNFTSDMTSTINASKSL